MSNDKDLFAAIEARDLNAVSEMIHQPVVHAYKQWCGQTVCMGEGTPELTHSTTRMERVTCEECKSILNLRARLSLEQRDEPREYVSNIEPNTGLRRHGEI